MFRKEVRYIVKVGHRMVAHGTNSVGFFSKSFSHSSFYISTKSRERDRQTSSVEKDSREFISRVAQPTKKKTPGVMMAVKKKETEGGLQAVDVWQTILMANMYTLLGST